MPSFEEAVKSPYFTEDNGLVKAGSTWFPRADLQAVDLEDNYRQGSWEKVTYRVVLIFKSGVRMPLTNWQFMSDELVKHRDALKELLRPVETKNGLRELAEQD